MLLIPSEEKSWYESNWFWRLSSDSCGGAAGLLTGRFKFLYWLLEMKWQRVQVQQSKPVAWDCSLYRPPVSTERSASCWSFFLPLSCEQCGHDKAEKGNDAAAVTAVKWSRQPVLYLLIPISFPFLQTLAGVSVPKTHDKQNHLRHTIIETDSNPVSLYMQKTRVRVGMSLSRSNMTTCVIWKRHDNICSR